MRWEVDGIIRKLLYFSFFMMPQGAALGTFSVGGWSVTSFRLAYLMIVFLFLLSAVQEKKIQLAKQNNAYSVKFLAFWVIYALFTILWVQDMANWVRQLTYVITGFLGAVFCVNAIRDKKDVINTLKAIQWGIVVQIFLGWNEVLWKRYYFILDPVEVMTWSRGLFGNPVGSQANTNDYATLMYLGVFISAILIYHCKGIWRWLYGGCLLSEIVLIAMSGSRANYAGLFLAFCFMLLMLGKKQIVFYLFGVGILCYGMIIILPMLGIDIIQQVSENTVFFAEGSDDVRMGLIMNGFYFLMRTFGLGVGPGQIESWMATESIFYRGDILNMHNYWMEIMTSYGFIVFIGFFIFYYRIWRDMVREAAQYSLLHDKILPMAIAAMMVGWVVSAVSASSIIKYDWLWAFWAIVIAYQGMLGEDVKS